MQADSNRVHYPPYQASDQLSTAIVNGNAPEVERLIFGNDVTPDRTHVLQLMNRATYQRSGEGHTRSVIKLDETNPQKPVLGVFDQIISYEETPRGYDQIVTTLGREGTVHSVERAPHRAGIRPSEHRRIAGALVDATPDQELFAGITAGIDLVYKPERVYGATPYFSNMVLTLHDDLFRKAETRLRQIGEYADLFSAVDKGAAEDKPGLSPLQKWQRVAALDKVRNYLVVPPIPPESANGASPEKHELSKATAINRELSPFAANRVVKINAALASGDMPAVHEHLRALVARHGDQAGVPEFLNKVFDHLEQIVAAEKPSKPISEVKKFRFQERLENACSGPFGCYAPSNEAEKAHDTVGRGLAELADYHKRNKGFVPVFDNLIDTLAARNLEVAVRTAVAIKDIASPKWLGNVGIQEDMARTGFYRLKQPLKRAAMQALLRIADKAIAGRNFDIAEAAACSAKEDHARELGDINALVTAKREEIKSAKPGQLRLNFANT